MTEGLGLGWGVGDGVELFVFQVHALHFFLVEGTGASATEDCQLVAAFVDGAVAVDAFRHSECWTSCAMRRDQLRCGSRTESQKPGIRLRREKLHNAQTILAVGDVGEEARAHHAQLDVIGVVEFVLCIEHLVKLRLLGPLDIDDGHAFFSRGNVGVGASDVNVSRV